MDNQTLFIAVGVAIIAIIAIAAFLFMSRRRRSHHLRDRFGPEYDRAVEDSGGRAKAEAHLHQREKRVEKFDIRPLRTNERDIFVASWREIQGLFVDDPKSAVIRADQLLGDVMGARGYPVGDFDQRSGDLSVDHPIVVQHYRAAHDIAERHGRGQASTEDLRQAMIHYRDLFVELTGEQGAKPGEPSVYQPPADQSPADRPTPVKKRRTA
jgi:hypothetical protein